MKYIEDVLGVKVHYQPWIYENKLPYYLSDRYELKKVLIGSAAALFLYPKTELEQLTSLKKQIAKIQMFESLPVVIILKSISRSRLQYMIAAHIPFIVLDKQIYLPFMGIALQNRFYAEPLKMERLQPASQVLLFYYIYLNKQKIYMTDITRALGFSGMTISRAIRQLEQTTFFSTEKEGVQKVLVGNYSGQELFEKMKPYLVSPVRKVLYIDKYDDLPKKYLSGMSALSQKSMLNPPEIMCYAINGKKGKLSGTEVLIDGAAQIKVELWKYDPGILATNGVVDPLSLVMSLHDELEERTQEAVEILLRAMEED